MIEPATDNTMGTTIRAIRGVGDMSNFWQRWREDNSIGQPQMRKNRQSRALEENYGIENCEKQ
jgi:hypothetical protein